MESVIIDNQSWLIYFTAIVTCLFAISEGLSLIPSVKSNGIFQLIFNILKYLAGKKDN
jgi:hypothetical protein